MNVYNEKGKLVSGTHAEPGWTREQIEESYARGCGWSSAEEMRKYYPLHQFRFEPR